MWHKSKEYRDIIEFNNLIKKIADKDKVALEDLYKEYGRLIYSSAFAIVKSNHLADEIVDDVLFKIWQLSPKMNFIKNARGWLYRVTVNSAKDRLKTEHTFDELFDMSTCQLVINTEENNFDFYIHIAKLNVVEQQILIFKFVEDLSFKQISKEIGKPLSTITSIYYRALEKLKNNDFE